MKTISLLNELFNFPSVDAPQREYIVDVAFPLEWFVTALAYDFCFDSCHVVLPKVTSIFVPIAVPCVCR